MTSQYLSATILLTKQLPSSKGEMRWAGVHGRVQVQALQAEPPPLQPQVLQGCARKRLTGLWKHHGKECVCVCARARAFSPLPMYAGICAFVLELETMQ